MYKIFVAVSGKRARIVPSASKPHVAERDFGDISREDALANRDGLFDAVRGLLVDKGITDGDLYTIEVPDDLAPRNVNETQVRKQEVAAADKGPVTKPKNPKKGEPGNTDTQPPVTDENPVVKDETVKE